MRAVPLLNSVPPTSALLLCRPCLPSEGDLDSEDCGEGWNQSVLPLQQGEEALQQGYSNHRRDVYLLVIEVLLLSLSLCYSNYSNYSNLL